MMGMFEGEIYTQAPNKVAFDTENDMFAFTSMIDNHNNDNDFQEGNEGYIYYEELFNGEPRPNMFDKIIGNKYDIGGEIIGERKSDMTPIYKFFREESEFETLNYKGKEYEFDLIFGFHNGGIDSESGNELPSGYYARIDPLGIGDTSTKHILKKNDFEYSFVGELWNLTMLILKAEEDTKENKNQAIKIFKEKRTDLINEFKEYINDYVLGTYSEYAGGGEVQDELYDLVSDFDSNEYEAFCYEFDIDIDDANQMTDFISQLSDEDAKNIINQIENGYFSDSEDEYAGGGGVKKRRRRANTQRGKTDRSVDKTRVAKPVGYRFSNSLASKLRKDKYAVPTEKQITKYLGKGIYKENRRNRSDRDKMVKL
jgi:hypothetical protein